MKRIAAIALILAVALMSGCVLEHASNTNATHTVNPANNANAANNQSLTPAEFSEKITLQKFKSVEDFVEYLDRAPQQSYFTIGFAAVEKGVETPTPVGITVDMRKEGGQIRFSTTNVQVEGIDEPDIVKTDGRNIYYSQIYRYWYYIRNPEGEKTFIISAYPPEKMNVSKTVNDGGNLLLYRDVLMIIGYREITAYKTDGMKEIWSIKLNGSYVDSRLIDGKLLLIARKPVSYPNPCPIKPMEVIKNGQSRDVVVGCSDIYHPSLPVYSDSTYTISVVDPKSGEVKKSVTLVGSAGKTVIYVSRKAVYLSYETHMDPAEMYYRFVYENRDLFPSWILEKIAKLRKYDISSEAKMVEIQSLMNRYMNSLSDDGRKKFENEMWNRMDDFKRKYGREIERTVIAKFSLDLTPIAQGSVPGSLLNQFSMDEYNGYLRVATTVRLDTTVNDVYVLDENLNVIGKVTDLGKGERIYAVRFLGDRGYVVTFRETDPLFVMDLSNPEKPELKGELKIPGYSSYLHPISDHLLLGIGKDGSYVKISLFDVSNPENPVEKDKYLLKEYWSDILTTHHAFLLDPKHKVFFLPAGSGGYIFSYENGIKLERAVSIPAKRAVYIGDYLYVIGSNSILAINEKDWRDVKEIKIG